MGKYLFVVRALPYEAGGTPIAVRSLLSYLSTDDFFVLGRRVHPAKRLSKTEVKQKMYAIPILFTKGHRFWKYFSILPGLIMGIVIIKKHKVNSIIGVFQDDASLILGYLLARIFPNLAFFPYLMDLYADQKTGGTKGFAEKVQSLVFRRAKKVLVANEGMRIFFEKKYNIPIKAVPIVSMPSDVSGQATPKNIKKPFTITYSGSINEDRKETLLQFAKQVKKDKRFRIKFLTPHNEAFFKETGLFHESFIYSYCKDTKSLFQQLNNSDLLYLPIRFTFPHSRRDQLITCFGAKTYDYLQCKVPILIHAPNYFFNYKLLKEKNAAFCLDTLDTKTIQAFLNFCFSEDFLEHTKKRVFNANKLAESFKGEQVADLFLASIS